jgi:hypothetical protein
MWWLEMSNRCGWINVDWASGEQKENEMWTTPKAETEEEERYRPVSVSAEEAVPVDVGWNDTKYASR